MLGPSNQDGPWPPPRRPWHSLRDPLDFPTSRNQPLSSYVMLLGSISSHPQADEPQELQAVAQFIIYPDYSEKLGTGDFALVQLASPINFIDLILPVCLPKPGDPLGNGTWCWVTGWGNIATNQRKDTGSMVGGGDQCGRGLPGQQHWPPHSHRMDPEPAHRDGQSTGEPVKYRNLPQIAACHPRPPPRGASQPPSQRTVTQGLMAGPAEGSGMLPQPGLWTSTPVTSTPVTSTNPAGVT